MPSEARLVDGCLAFLSRVAEIKNMNIPTKVVTGKNFDQTFYIHSLDLKTFIKSCPLFMKLHTNLKTFEIETRYENTETILN